MSIETTINNELIREECGIWRLSDHSAFAYSDGSHAERYLRSVFERDLDLSSGSPDLQPFIKDWPSEYHLTNKRAQLLDGFEFDRSLKVLEVGCGCGAITRYLAENFDQVVSIEGSPSRARLAQMRTRDCDNVSIVCAPFQKLEFAETFDLIICVGVLEYSALFVDEDDPYEHVLKYFSELLNDSGQVVIAIENQFGLKYFASSREDHLKQMFEGIEGYPVYADKVRTFGRVELDTMISRHFASTAFYYPYPDYKIPDAVLSESLLQSGKAAELVAGFPSRDYYGQVPKLFEESLATLELARNELLPSFANSFIVVAGKQADNPEAFPQLGVMYSSGRAAPYRMQTRFVADGDGIQVSKRRLHPGTEQDQRVTAHAAGGPWVGGYSLQTRLLKNCLARTSTLSDCFSLVGPWLDKLKEVRGAAALPNAALPGNYVDCIWKNSFSDNGEVTFIDQEWEAQAPLPLEVLFIRAMFYFLLETQELRQLPRYLRASNTRKLITTVAKQFDLNLTAADFQQFCEQETEFQSCIYNKNPARTRLTIRWYLSNRASVRCFAVLQRGVHKLSLVSQSLRRLLRLP